MINKIKNIIKVEINGISLFLFLGNIIGFFFLFVVLFLYFCTGSVLAFDETSLGLFFEVLDKKDIPSLNEVQGELNNKNSIKGLSVTHIVITGTIIGLFLICIYTGMSYISVKYYLEFEPEDVVPLVESATDAVKNVVESSGGFSESKNNS